ncbi:conserved hypothetical protein [uncultured Desulfobacterium sp.]|uniref:diguanylate cyclase n=1 Tax=uncultured Desulfobacterium sp. TaxID=201089 RepID=A0A445MQW8_9BACT|nr:conserved hypothetical protein [uncultured Desulfobacterium sp.]
MSALSKLLNKDIKVPSPPSIAMNLLKAVKNDASTYKEIAGIISSDPALTAKTLKIANSPFYGLSRKIDSIERAISVLGVTALKNIALSFTISQGFSGRSSARFDFNYFWKRAITAAIGAELTAAMIGKRSDDTFVTGLLQDIGILILYYCLAHEYAAVIAEKKTTGLPISQLEKEMFGFDHQELGSEILKEWGLPETISIPIYYHHHEKNIPEQWESQSQVLFLSNKISSLYHGAYSSKNIRTIRPILQTRYGVSQEDCDNLIDAVANKAAGVISLFEVEAGELKPFSEILQEANEELGKLNLSYEQLLIEYKEAKQRAEHLANDLKEANDKLRELSIKDGLTGLYNHRHFQDLFDTELHRSKRYKTPLTLMMIDLDHFKGINDAFGHPVGDKVLQSIAKEMMECVRATDIVARYGGEEFAIIMPGTGSKNAAITGERLRKAIEKMEIAAGGLIIKTTVSIGVATYTPEEKECVKSLILNAADKALYSSKKAGRNKLSIASI